VLPTLNLAVRELVLHIHHYLFAVFHHSTIFSENVQISVLPVTDILKGCVLIIIHYIIREIKLGYEVGSVFLKYSEP
jgi:hypothetical protein